MFIFNRPFQPVAAGLAVALLFVCLDRSYQPLDATPDRPSVASRQAALVTAHYRPRTTGYDSRQDAIIIGDGAVGLHQCSRPGATLSSRHCHRSRTANVHAAGRGGACCA